LMCEAAGSQSQLDLGGPALTRTSVRAISGPSPGS
jgi:hypothetical protein